MTEIALFLMLSGFLLVTGKLWWDQTELRDRVEYLEELDEARNQGWST